MRVVGEGEPKKPIAEIMPTGGREVHRSQVGRIRLYARDFDITYELFDLGDGKHAAINEVFCKALRAAGVRKWFATDELKPLLCTNEDGDPIAFVMPARLA